LGLDEEPAYVVFQSSVRINVGPNEKPGRETTRPYKFQSSVRINVGPNVSAHGELGELAFVSILRED